MLFYGGYIQESVYDYILISSKTKENQSRTNGPIKAHLTIAQVMLKYNHNNEKQEALSKYLQ